MVDREQAGDDEAADDPPERDHRAGTGDQGADDQVGRQEADRSEATSRGIGEAVDAGGGDAERLGDRADPGHGGAGGQGGEQEQALVADPDWATKTAIPTRTQAMMVWRRASSRSAKAGMISPATTRMPMPSAVKSPTSPASRPQCSSQSGQKGR